MSDTQTPSSQKKVISHSCGARWTGSQRSHCGGCHLTFSSLTSFEMHRRGLRCNAPESVGLVTRETEFGAVWGKPGPSPAVREALAAAWAAQR